MNRNDRTKDNFDLSVLEDLEEQPSHTLEELQKNSAWFNCSQDEIDEIKQGFLEKSMRSHLFRKRKEPLDPVKIVKQFMDFFPTISEEDPTAALCHNFDMDSSDWKKLFQWSKRESVIDLLNPVHYNIYTQYGLNNKPPKSLNSVFYLQNAFIWSHMHETAFSSGDLIKQVELLLNCTVTRLYLTTEILVCLFEWQSDDTFGLTICFSQRHPDSKKLGDGKMTVLERSDLFDDTVGYIEDSVANGEDEEKKGERKESALTMERLRTIVRECKLSYIYYGFVMRPT